MSGSISCHMGHTHHSYVLSVTWTVGYAIKSSMTLNRVICLNLTPFEIFMSALTLDSSCRHCRVLCCVFLCSSFSSVKQEQIISTSSVWGYVECEKILPGDAGMGWVKILSAGQEVWELVDLHKVIKKCLGEEIRGTKGGSPRKGNKRAWLHIKYSYVTEPCAWSPQSVLSSFKPFLTMYLCHLTLHPCVCVLHGLTASYWGTGCWLLVSDWDFRCPYLYIQLSVRTHGCGVPATSAIMRVCICLQQALTKTEREKANRHQKCVLVNLEGVMSALCKPCSAITKVCVIYVQKKSKSQLCISHWEEN